MLSVPQNGAPQDQKRNFRIVLARSSKKPTSKPQKEGCSSGGNLHRPRRGQRRKSIPAYSGHYHFIAGVECLAAKIPNDRALLQESTEITFSDEDMEVGYPDHKRPLYLAASINQIPIKRALVNTGTFVNLSPLSILQAVGISERKIQGCPMEVTGFGERGEYIIGHIQLWLKLGRIASLARFHAVKTEVSYHVLLGRP